jgi:large subunit ribosomal protein L17
MAISLIEYKRIKTTVAKAKELRKFIEPLLTRAKKVNSAETVKESSHNTRVIYRYLQNKGAVKTLCTEVAAKIADRPGGYVRILKTGFRTNDAAEMCIIELVDYNEAALETQTKKKKRTRRGRRKKSSDNANTEATTVVADDEDAVVENKSGEEEE